MIFEHTSSCRDVNQTMPFLTPTHSFLVSTYFPRSHRNRRGPSAPAEIRKSGFHKISQELLSLVDSWLFKGHSEHRDIPWQELAQKLMDLPSNGKNKHVCLPSSKVLFRFRQIVYLIKKLTSLHAGLKPILKIQITFAFQPTFHPVLFSSVSLSPPLLLFLLSSSFSPPLLLLVKNFNFYIGWQGAIMMAATIWRSDLIIRWS